MAFTYEKRRSGCEEFATAQDNIRYISFGLFIFLVTIVFLIFYFFKPKQRQEPDDDPLMNTLSTTTLSTRSISNDTKNL
jgi:hypothetical protein